MLNTPFHIYIVPECFKFVQNLSYKNEFDLNENEPVGKTHFHMNGFAQKLVLTKKQKATWKRPIRLVFRA